MRKIFLLCMFFCPLQLLNSQNTYIVTYDTILKQEILIGRLNKNDLMNSDFAEYFYLYHEAYKPEVGIINKLKHLINDVNITIVMGTWCSDSQEQIPKFYKIINLLEYDENKILLIGVDKKKQAREYESLVQSLNIEKIPTFIFYKDEKEISRIIESPETTLEMDMLKILNK
ncbi:MAG: thioredoxin family protein [Bacteroidales bacterium]|nr:thioredoxin family protein [Bacteroidales bacterium]